MLVSVRATWMPWAMCTRRRSVTTCASLGRVNISLSTEYSAGRGSKFCWYQISMTEGCPTRQKDGSAAADDDLSVE